jgi:hypothetical protein
MTFDLSAIHTLTTQLLLREASGVSQDAAHCYDRSDRIPTTNGT